MTTAEHTRTQLLAALAELGRLRPDWRVGQMLANVAMAAGLTDAGGVWDLVDGEALTAALTLIGQCDEGGAGVDSNSRTDSDRSLVTSRS